MKKLLIITLFVFLAQCSTEQKPVKKTGADAPKTVNEIKPVKAEAGWTDDDTYTVVAAALNEATAKELAKRKTLKDVVDVRVKNGSRYTDIIQIGGEFKNALNNAKVISRKYSDKKDEIYFQIREKGLKGKFERK